jgi:hypothetical protein
MFKNLRKSLSMKKKQDAAGPAAARGEKDGNKQETPPAAGGEDVRSTTLVDEENKSLRGSFNKSKGGSMLFNTNTTNL